ncbi:hypothetical protein EV356DRAFT_571398 [Viridothelium virens]|uniref:Uncharacterized protein n=1 Tax=Viridothelium virens TaxID=1048519 RepID=A0A6A6GUC2_VIRVR|nr:hypothetical protein EV356DRAFT_571398 [Viridothelium virens]
MYSAAEPIAETSIRAGDASPNSHDQHTNAPRSHPSFSPNGVQVVTVNKEQAEVYALLITPELLDCLQNNISTFKNADSLDKQISYLEEGLDHAQNKLSETEECLAELLGHERTPEKDTVKATREEIEDLTQRKTSLQQWIMNFEDTLGQHRQEQFSANFAKKLHETTLYDLLRKPLQQSALLPPTQTVPPASGIDSFSIHLDNDNFEDETHSFFVHTQGYQQSQTSSEALRMELRVAIEEKQNEVEEYRHKLDTFPEIYAKNAAQFNENAANGIQQGSIETFDQWHFILKGDITRGLIKAEDELQLIKLQAHEAGVEHAFDDASIFQDDPDDGYAESLEDDMIRSAPYARIQGWRDSIPTNGREDIANTIPTCDGDDWEATPVEIGDSISCIGHEDQGRRIRRWEEMKLQIH